MAPSNESQSSPSVQTVTLDLVYFDAKIGSNGMTYGFGLVPSTFETPRAYDWKKHGVKLFLQNTRWEYEEVKQIHPGDTYILAPPEQTVLILIQTGAEAGRHRRLKFTLPSLIGDVEHTHLT
ncbi:hypothetical protein PQX77_016248 [Marasmius sp. AFHP31]|nr:hypothetical protein PQX77_016246 [Marasmius sp. AFHP31]KAK1220951.1 hypothetical protein PQX77_016247 [Marasmius sp. AFHP31]KAK1220952.1 hypothetical protein PQX77_016248 [Marasmius sp. AFHP31]